MRELELVPPRPKPRQRFGMTLGLEDCMSVCRGVRVPGCAIVAVAHEMARIMFFILSRNEPYRDADGELVERKLKNMGKRAQDGLRN